MKESKNTDHKVEEVKENVSKTCASVAETAKTVADYSASGFKAGLCIAGGLWGVALGFKVVNATVNFVSSAISKK